MHDLQFLEAAAISTIAWPDPSRIRYDAPREALAVFKTNSLRAMNLCALPGFSFWMGVEWGSAGTRASRELIGEVDPTLDLLRPVQNELLVLCHKYMAESMNLPERERRERLQMGTTECEHHMRACGEDIIAMLERQLQSIIIQSWTAFEVLCADLLTSSIEKHAECFAHLSGTEKFRFYKRELLRDAYELAFRGDGRVKNQVKQQSLDALCLLRNLLVHKSGRVDDTFREQCTEAHLTGWAALPEKTQFQCTGKVISSLLPPTIKSGCSLVKAVDKWLAENKP